MRRRTRVFLQCGCGLLQPPRLTTDVVLGCAQLLLIGSKKKQLQQYGQRMQHRCQFIPPWWDNLSLHYGHKDYVG
jgi:hypothetical protein